MKQYWIVAPMDCPESAGKVSLRTNASTLGDGLAQPRGEGRNQRGEAVPAPAQPQGFGYVPDASWAKKITHVFTTKAAAEAAAQDVAGKYPKTLFGVFGVTTTFETTTPTVIQKQFNEDGELVVKS